MTPSHNPYPGPRPFRENDSKFFVGRERETADLADLIYAFQTVLLYAQSGAGKSSLVAAALIPALGNKERCLLARVAGEEPDAEAAGVNLHTWNVLASSTGARPASGATLGSLARNDGSPWFLVLDQFEELFTAYPDRWTQREPFFREIQALLKADPGARILFVMREEYLAELDRFRKYVPQHFDVQYRLERLKRPDAIRAIAEPARLSGDEQRAARMQEVAPAIADNLLLTTVVARGSVRSIPGEYVEPLHLQVVCSDLWADLDQLTDQQARARADVDTALVDYYDAAVRRSRRVYPLRESRIRKWFEEQLITPSGTRGIVYLDPKSGSAGRLPKGCVDFFEEQRLIRMERRPGGQWYELTHDRFIGPIREANANWHRRRNKRIAMWLMPIVVVVALVAVLKLNRLDSENAKLSIDTKKLSSTAETLKNENVRLSGENKTLSTMSKYAENRISVLETALDPGSAPAQKADALKRLALSQAIAGKGREASQLIVEAERVSSSVSGPAAVRSPDAPRDPRPENQPRAGRSQQKERLIRAGGNLTALNASERRYVCEHNYYVIGASEKIEEAQSEIDRRWRKVYPNAVAGVPQPNLGLTPIVFDYFLTCEEARQLAADIQARYKSGPMVRQWYTELSCAPCSTPAAVPRP